MSTCCETNLIRYIPSGLEAEGRWKLFNDLPVPDLLHGFKLLDVEDLGVLDFSEQEVLGRKRRDDFRSEDWQDWAEEDEQEHNKFLEENVEYPWCQMCRRERPRYVHIMTHPRTDLLERYFGGKTQIRVGCICNLHMQGLIDRNTITIIKNQSRRQCPHMKLENENCNLARLEKAEQVRKERAESGPSFSVNNNNNNKDDSDSSDEDNDDDDDSIVVPDDNDEEKEEEDEDDDDSTELPKEEPTRRSTRKKNKLA